MLTFVTVLSSKQFVSSTPAASCITSCMCRTRIYQVPDDSSYSTWLNEIFPFLSLNCPRRGIICFSTTLHCSPFLLLSMCPSSSLHPSLRSSLNTVTALKSSLAELTDRGLSFTLFACRRRHSAVWTDFVFSCCDWQD